MSALESIPQLEDRVPVSRRVFGRVSMRWVVLSLAVLFVWMVYVFFVTAGTFSHWPTYNANYDLLAEGFRAGHLYIPVLPAPQLLAAADPFDYSNRPYWFWDMSFYKGHYYLYWGPLPAAILALVKNVFRFSSRIGDQYVVFWSYAIYILSGSLFIERMSRRLFPTVPVYFVVM